MATINLLPWRDEYRQEKTREFFSILSLLLVLVALIGYVWYAFVQSEVKSQRERNGLLDKEIAEYEQKVKEISQLKNLRRDLEDKMDIIQNLQTKRPLVVHYFDELVKAVPEGIYFKHFSRKGDVFAIGGIAKSNNQVSALMRNLDRSKYFQSPNLKNVGKGGFDLTVEAAAPKNAGSELSSKAK